MGKGMLALFIMMCLLMPLSMIGNLCFEVDKNRENTIEETSPNLDMRIMINGDYFDPLKETPNIPSELKLMSPNGYYVVQVNGPVLSEWREGIEETGAFIHGYIPNFAYLVEMTPEIKNKVEKLNFVRWIGNYEPGYKIDKKLLTRTDEVKVNVALFKQNDFLNGIFPHNIDKIAAVQQSKLLSDGLSMDKKLPTTKTRLERDTSFGHNIRGMKDISKTILDLKDIRDRSTRSMFSAKVESFDGKIINWSEKNTAVVEINSSKLNNILFMKKVRYVNEWHPKRPFMDQISATTYMGFDYVQYPYEAEGAETFDGSKWSARFGKDCIIGAVQDNGIDGDHPAFDDPDIPGYQSRCGDTYGIIPDESHGTAVAGIIFGYPDGVIPKGYFGFIYWYTADSTAADFVLSHGGYFISHSYGSSGSTGAYSTISAGIDNVLYDRAKMTFAWASGCTGSASPAEEATAKNVISVGGVYQGLSETTTTDDYYDGVLTGPTDDGRMKPDLCGPADMIYTLDSNGGYTSMFGGTSGATPCIAGAAGIALEMYVEDYWSMNPYNDIPLASTVKALSIANAEQYPISQIPRYRQGWGYPHIPNLVERAQYIVDGQDSLSTGGSILYNDIPSTAVDPLKITLVWTDYPGTAAADGDTAPDLVNDLNLRVVEKSTGKVYYGNMGLLNDIWSTSGTGTNPWSGGGNPDNNYDDLNNVENVFIQSPTGSYDIYVEGYNVPVGPQPFSLVVSGMAPGTGKLSFDREPAVYSYGDTAKITLVDADLNTNPSVVDTSTVHINTTKDEIGFDLVLYETGTDTNTFADEIRCSIDYPEFVNDGETHTEYNIIAVNEVDNIQITYHDLAPVDAWRNVTARYDAKPPVIRNVTVSDVKYSSFNVEFDTAELSKGRVSILAVDSNKTDNDMMNNIWESEGLEPATIEDYRNGKTSTISDEDTGYKTHHTFTFFENYPNTTYLFYVSARDNAGNYAEDTNAGEMYKLRTMNQPFDILIVWDDVGTAAGVYYDWYGLMYSGYYPVMTVGFGAESSIFDWNGSFEFCSYSNHFVKATNQEYWDAMVSASANGTENIVIWDTGIMCAEIALWDSFPPTGFVATDIFSTPTYTINATERGMLQTFLDTKKGNVVFHGVGWWEDARDRSDVLTFMHDYMHANPESSGGTSPGTAAGYDVVAGVINEDWSWNDDNLCFVGLELTPDAVVMTESYQPVMAFSSDEINGSGYGGTNELAWSSNNAGGTPSAHYGAVSCEHTADAKTFYASAGDAFYGGGSMSDYVYNAGVNYGYGISNLTTYWKNIIKWMADNTSLGSTTISGTVYDGAVPLADATVYAFAVDDTTTVLGVAKTNETGYYTLNVTAGTYDLIAFKGGHSADNTSHTGTNAVTITAGENISNTDFALTTAVGDIEGVIRIDDPFWGPLKTSDICVKAEGPTTKTVLSSSNGYYHIDDLPVGTYTVTAYDLRYINASYTYSGIGNETELIDVLEGQNTNINFVLDSGSISGVVYESDGVTPIQNGYVYAVETNKEITDGLAVQSTMTDERGYYHLSHISDNSIGYYVRAEANGKHENENHGYFSETYHNNTNTIVYVDLGGDTTNIYFTLNKSIGSVSGFVTNGSAPSSGATVIAELTAIGDDTSENWVGREWYAYTNPDGSWVIKNLVNGTYNITAAKQGYTSVTQNNIVVSPLGIAVVPDIVLDVSAGFTILYVDDDGGAMDDANTLAAIQANIPTTISGNTTGVSYVEWDVAAQGNYPTTSYMAGYDMVIWTTGGYYSGSPHGDAEDVLMAYLDNGGRLFLTSQDWEYDHGISDFVKDYLKVDCVYRDTMVSTSLDGRPGDPISGDWAPPNPPLPLGEMPFSDWADWLTPSADGIWVFKEHGTENIVAVRYEGTYKSYFTVFPFEFVTTGIDANTYMGRIIDWMSIPPNQSPVLSGGRVTPEIGTTSTSFTFYVNYTDIENALPCYVKVTVDGQTYDMVEVSPADTTTDDGKQYMYVFGMFSTMGEHTFSFSANDSATDANAVGDVWNHTGPVIDDTTSPVINHTQHVFTAYAYTDIIINVTVTDNVKVESVKMYWQFTAGKKVLESGNMVLSDNQLDSDEFMFVIPGQPPGSVEYYFVASDGTNTVTDDNSGMFYEILITGENQSPVVNITYPSDNQTVNGTVTVNGTTSDPDGNVTAVHVRINYLSWQLATGTTSWSFEWNTTTVSNGWHTICARSYDGLYYSTIDSVNVYVDNPIPNQPPTANFTYSPASPTTSDIIQFNDTSTDTDGFIQEWYWEFSDGNTSILQNTTHQYSSAGDYSVSLTVTDDDGASDTKTVWVNVTLSYQGTLSGYVKDNITSDPISGALVNVSYHETYQNTYTNETGYYYIDNIPTCECAKNVTASKEGYITKTEWIGIGEGTWLNFTLEAISVNQPPTANFTFTPGSPTTDDIIQFNDTSTDSDGNIQSWFWDFGDGSNSTEQKPTHQYANEGVYNVTLTVWDDDNANATIMKSVTVTHVNHPPEITYCHPETNPAIPENKSQYFNITAYDPDDDTIYYYWYLNGSLVGTSDNYTFDASYDSAGIYTVNITIIDGGDYDYHEWNLTVTNVNRPPEIIYYYPDYDPAINETETQQFLVNGSDQDENSLRYYWYVNGSLQAENRIFDFITNYSSEGVYNITVVVSDEGYNDTHSWIITILNKNRAPTAIISSPVNNAEFTTKDSVFFDATVASDPDNDNLTYTWASTIDGNIGNTASFSKKLSKGTHTITLTVDDGNNGVDTAQITITVKKPSEPTIFIPGFETTIILTGVWLLAIITVLRKRKKIIECVVIR